MVSGTFFEVLGLRAAHGRLFTRDGDRRGAARFNGIEVGAAVDVYVPVAMQQEVEPPWGRRLGDWRSRWLVCMAPLKDGVSLKQARAEASVVYAQVLREDLAHIEAKSLVLLPGGRGVSNVRDESSSRSWCSWAWSAGCC